MISILEEREHTCLTFSASFG